jgi:hypothetical protein
MDILKEIKSNIDDQIWIRAIRTYEVFEKDRFVLEEEIEKRIQLRE